MNESKITIKEMALPEPRLIEPASLEVPPALRDSRQRWRLLGLLFTAMLASYVHRSAGGGTTAGVSWLIRFDVRQTLSLSIFLLAEIASDPVRRQTEVCRTSKTENSG